MKIFLLQCSLVVVLGLTGIVPVQSETYTYKDLVHRLTDLDHLAVRPVPGEQGALASSWDRASTYDTATDTYHHWDANGDGGGIIRQEGDESVFAEIKGPGVIWRTWSATANPGHVKIYLDGSETPTIDLPFIGYFDGTNPPFNRPNLVYRTASNGVDNFTPIPFLKSCKIVADKDWGSYYHFNYTTFPEGTIVPTFKLPLSAEDSAALDEANKIFGNLGSDPAGTRPGQKTEQAELTIKPGAKATVSDLSGSGAITALKAKFTLPTDPEEQKNFLRQITVSITWDKDKAPSVWSPIGDFFADAVMPVKYRNLITGITDDGQWYSYWYMPYASKAHIEVQNDSAAPVTMTWEVTHAPLTKPIDSLLRFHAKWHRDSATPMRKDRLPDWSLLTTQGTGRYVGTQLHLWNPRGGWWGEGDEKWFVDGEKFPSTIGTGSEDYFGFAWSSGSPFHEPMHGQPANEGNNGHASLYRWHIADNIPFQKSFEGVIEKYFSNSRPTLYDAVAFWYLSPGGTDPYTEIPVANRIGYWKPVGPKEAIDCLATKASEEGTTGKATDAIEGEDLKCILGDSEAQGMNGKEWGNRWSNGSQLWWTAQRADAEATFELPPQKAGKYRLVVCMTQAPDYGIVQLSINGTKVGKPLDLYGTKVSPTESIELGTVTLKDGANILGMEAVGTNEKAGGYLVGLDYLKLIPVP